MLRSNKGKSNGLEEIFTHPRTWSPTFGMLYIKDFGACEDEKLAVGLGIGTGILSCDLVSFGIPASPTSLSL